MTTYRPCVCGHPDFAHLRTVDVRPCTDCACNEYRYVGFDVTLDEHGGYSVSRPGRR